MGSRHRARRLAAQALYALEANEDASPQEALAAVLAEGSPEVQPEFVEALVRGVCQHRAEIDAALERFSHHWKLRRMDRVDRSILRLGAHELLHCPDTPAPIVLDEAVELAKEFGTAESAAFVNGILDRVARDLRPSEVADRKP